ncbi:MAG TPA: Mov34/MPN/PAD-1 family protein [Thermoanaerobaculia bacterium]|nr:Mov34/MPN/PAD-1 family protein [Thermoanaerobaculia bacterium]
MTVFVMLLLMGLKPDVVREPQVQVLMRGLLRDARSGFEHREEAAFIVRAKSGNYYSIEWPSTGELDSARWEGAFPEGTVAIAHTHPTHLPNPSTIDATVARNVHVPVYVVTHSRITRTDGAGAVVVAEW